MLLHAQYVRRKPINDVTDTPFSFLFDETTNSQVKKQCGGYVVYWPKQYCRVVHTYCGSFFVGHCDVDALVNHYLDLVKAFELDSSVLYFKMDGPIQALTRALRKRWQNILMR